MKKHIVIMLWISNIACSTQSKIKRDITLVSVEKLIMSVSLLKEPIIDNGSEDIAIQLKFENKGEDIYIQNPECILVNDIKLFQNEVELQKNILFRVNPECMAKKYLIVGNTSRTFNFPYKLNLLYQLTKEKKYKLIWGYKGLVANYKDSLFCNPVQLSSTINF